MNRRRFAVAAALLVLAMLGSAAPVRADNVPFYAEGTAIYTAENEKMFFIWLDEGRASLLGPFTGVTYDHFMGHRSEGFKVITGTNGDSITWFQEYEEVEPNVWVATWVVTGGTGRFEGVTGVGGTIGSVTGPGVFEYRAEGVLCFPH